jgi:hypothetical protein
MAARTIIDEREFLELLGNGKLPVEIARHFGVSPAAITKKLKKYRPNPVVQQYTRERRQGEQAEQSGKQYTEKKARYVEARLAGKKPAQAAMIAYECSTPQSAAVIGHKMEKDSQVKRAIADCLIDAGVTPTYRAGKIRSILEEGSFDHQLKALDHTAKLTGDYTININLKEEITLESIANDSRDLFLEVRSFVDELRNKDSNQVAVALWDGGQRLCISYLEKECGLQTEEAERALQEWYAGKPFISMPYIKEALQGKFINFNCVDSDIINILCRSSMAASDILSADTGLIDIAEGAIRDEGI